MKIEKIDLSRIIKESLSDEAYEAGYNDALRDRPHGSNPDMRDLDSRAYDHGFDKGTAERMDLQRPLGTRGFHESKTITGATVKITKRQLRSIIREAINERSGPPEWWQYASRSGLYKSYDALVDKGKAKLKRGTPTEPGAGKMFKGYLASIFDDITDKDDPFPKVDPIVQKFLSAKPEIKGIAMEIGFEARYADDKEKQREAMKAILSMLGAKQ